MRWLSVHEVAEMLEWDPAALHRLLTATKGTVLPGAIREEDHSWSVPESAVRRITGAGLFLFSIPRLAELLDCDAENLRRQMRAGRLRVIRVPNVGIRVPWSEYQRLLGRMEQ